MTAPMLFLMSVFCFCFNYKRISAKKQEAFFNYFQKHYEKTCNIMKQKMLRRYPALFPKRRTVRMKNSFTSGENRMLNGFAYRIQNSRIKREGSEFLLRRTFSRNFHVVSSIYWKDRSGIASDGKRAGKAPVFKPGFLIKFLQQYLLQVF